MIAAIEKRQKEADKAKAKAEKAKKELEDKLKKNVEFKAIDD